MKIALASTTPEIDTQQLKRTGAAKDFESLLIAQMLRSVREEASGWLGGDDQTSDAASGLGEEQLARALTSSGGLGLTKVIEKGLRANPAQGAALPKR